MRKFRLSWRVGAGVVTAMIAGMSALVALNGGSAEAASNGTWTAPTTSSATKWMVSNTSGLIDSLVWDAHFGGWFYVSSGEAGLISPSTGKAVGAKIYANPGHDSGAAGPDGTIYLVTNPGVLYSVKESTVTSASGTYNPTGPAVPVDSSAVSAAISSDGTIGFFGSKIGTVGVLASVNSTPSAPTSIRIAGASDQITSMVYDSTKSGAWAASSTSAVVALVSSTGVIGQVTGLPGPVSALALNASGGKLYAALTGGGVAVIDTATRAVSSQIVTAAPVSALAYDPGIATLAMAEKGADQVQFYDTAGGTIYTTTSTYDGWDSTAISKGASNPVAIAFNPSTHDLAVGSVGDETRRKGVFLLTYAQSSGVAPTITTNPSNVTVAAGSTATFTAAASGTPAPTLTWQVSTDGGTTFANSTISGCTTGTSCSFTTTASQTGYKFRVVAANGVSPDATSTAATLTVTSPPTITTTSLANGTVGTSYSVNLAASGGATPYVWSISSGSLPAGLTLNSSTGAITGTPTTAGSFTFTVKVTDANSQTATKPLSITVAVGTPTITTTSLSNGMVGTSYTGSVAASGGTTPYTWAVSSGSLPAGLTLNPSTGAITGTPTTAGSSTFTVKVTDANSQTATKPLSITVDPAALAITTTSLPAGQVGSSYNATLVGSGGTTPYTWSVTTGSLPAGLTLNSSTGAITGTPTTAASTTFTVTLKDNAGRTTTQTYTVSVSTAPVPPTITTTSLANGTVGTLYSQTVAASGGLAPYAWAVSSGTLPAGLSLNSSTGAITGTPTTAGTSNVTFKVTDANNLSSTKALTITIIGVPTITTTSLANGTVGASYTGSVAASGGTGPYTWAVSSGTLPAGLSLNPSTGAITGTPTATGTSNFTVKVTDANSQTATKSLSITVDPAALAITTSSLSAGQVGSSYSATLVGSGGTTPYTWSVSAGTLPAGLSLNPSTGAITGTPTTAGTSSFTVKLTDAGSQTVTKPLAITVAPAPLAITTASLSNGQVGGSYNATLAATGGTTPYTWSVSAGTLPAGLSLNSSTGAITGTPTTAGTSSFTVKLTDAGSQTVTKPLAITVAPAPLLVTTTSLPGGQVGTSYNQTLAASGGTTPYTWSVSAGTLPAGLSLNPSTGAITGTPTTAGTSTFTVKATDNDGTVATKSLTITVIAKAPTITTTSPLAAGQVGSSYSANLSASGGQTPLTWSLSGATSLPAGLSLNASTGAITGTPTAAGTTSFNVTVTDTNGQSDTKTFSITVAAAPVPPTITTATLITGEVGSSYSASLAATSGTAPYTWSISSGSLPAGLALNPSTGAISGTPTTPGSTTFTVKVTDSKGLTDTKSLTITISAKPIPLAIVTTSLPSGIVGGTYAASAVAQGGTTPYTWSATGLPAGLTINPSSGAISGTPTVSGTFSVALTVKDASSPQATVTDTFNLVVRPALVVNTSPALPDGTVGTAYSATVSASGGDGTYTFSVPSGLPAGLSMNSAGVISGTPTAATISNFTVNVSDGSGHTASAPMSITIAPAPVVITTASSLPAGQAGSPYTASLAATGGTGPYTWSTTDSLGGLSLSASGALSGTPISPGTITFTATVKDSGAPVQQVNKLFTIVVSPAPLQITTTSLPTGQVGTGYSSTLTASGGVTPYTWSIGASGLPGGLSLSPAGVLSGTPTSAGTTSVNVIVTDSASQSTTVTLPITIASAPIPLSITTTALDTGTVGQAYSQPLAASGGTMPYSWSIISGSLPAGLGFSPSTGVISGTPTVAGTKTITVRVTDSASPAAQIVKTLDITIDPAPITLVLDSSGVGSGQVGQLYTGAITTSGGTAPYTFTTTDPLPAGLTLNADGTISGTPTAAGTTSFVVTATDSTSPTANTGSATVIITISPAPAPLVITTTALDDGMVGVNYSASLAATGGTGSYSWAITSGTLPDGLSMTPAGVISGLPSTAETATLTFEVTDGASPASTATVTLSLTIAPAPVSVEIVPVTPDEAVVGESYSLTLQAAGGTMPYTWSVTTGSLPDGLTLSSDGTIMGTPTTTGESTFTVQVTDSSSPAATDTAEITLRVVAAPTPLAIATTSLGAATAGLAYTNTLAATGGSGAGTYHWASADAPSWMTVADDGTISGTPPSAGSVTFNVDVTDESSPAQTATTTLTLVINAAPVPLAITNTGLPDATVGEPYDEQLNATGGDGTYLWSATGLPAGLSLGSDGRITGTVTDPDGDYPVEVTVTDGTGATAIASWTLHVGPAPVPTVQIDSTTLGNATAGQPYSITLLASGGTAPIHWSSPDAPTWLTVGDDGTVSALDPVVGTYNVTITVTDSSSGTPAVDSKVLTLIVSPAPLALAIDTTSPLPGAVAGSSYSQTLLGSGGDGLYHWASPDLPTWLTLSDGGVLSGTPTSADLGSATFSVVLTDESGADAAVASFTVTVTAAPEPIAIATTSLAPATEGISYHATLAATGGTGDYTWSATGVPSWMTVAADGTISGVPPAGSAGTVTLSVTVSDSASPAAQASTDLTLTIAAASPLMIATSSLPAGMVGSAYAPLAIAAIGGAGSYSWSVTGGSLPAGMTLTGDGILSGTPSESGDFSVKVTVTDGSATTSKTLSLRVLPALAVTTPAPSALVVGTPTSLTLTVTGGDGSYSAAVTGGTLPAGLTLSGLTISGTPTTPGSYSVQITVTDGSGHAVTVPVTFSVGATPVAVSVTTDSLLAGTIGAAYSQSLAASGGTKPYAWTVSGTLPPGLTLSALGLLAGTPTATGSWTFTVTATDATGSSASRTLTVVVNATKKPATTDKAPVIVTQPSNASSFVNGSATFKAAATGSPAPTITWQVSTDGGKTWTTVGTGSTLTVSNLKPAQSGNLYRAVASNRAGTATSASAKLTVTESKLPVTTQPGGVPLPIALPAGPSNYVPPSTGFAATGADVAPIGLVALVLLGTGTVLVGIRRRTGDR